MIPKTNISKGTIYVKGKHQKGIHVRGFWDPIPVSPDTVETTTEFAGDGEEVDRPADVFGTSLSGNLYFDP
ncbi:hypothetical protein IGI04_019357 [Brassica rapa subsp. trilocularis]|uniref:Uncharacterized protein n=1 Tax=Brassica rapa subsp. trilocularis TaxID=1813537 RepID=A0ABQ7MH66_BRACM|nr:hypothetical protein IGI04_019357 [Brassica rapa subsp. trilocularis]